MCHFGRRHHEEQTCESILNLDQWLKRECCLKVFLIGSSGASPFVQRSETICKILVEDYMRNKFCEIILNLDQWFRRRCRFKDFWSLSGPPVR